MGYGDPWLYGSVVGWGGVAPLTVGACGVAPLTVGVVPQPAVDVTYHVVRAGWMCPCCRRVYSPDTPMCLSCPPKVEMQPGAPTTG